MQNEPDSDCLDRFIQHCREFGLKITPQRCAVYKEIVRTKSHPTADEMFQIVKKEYPNISYDTVNRTLLTFAEVGLVDVVPTKGGPRRFDPDMDNHHHFHCIRCGKIVDFLSEEFDNLGIPGPIQDEFTVFTKRVVMNGLCSKCRKDMRKQGLKLRDAKKLNK